MCACAFVVAVCASPVTACGRKKALREPKALILCSASILLISPLLGFILIHFDGVLQFPEFATGLAMFVVAPTTISSAVVIVALVDGNVAMSLILSVGTNLLAVREACRVRCASMTCEACGVQVCEACRGW